MLETRTYFAADGTLIHQETVEVPDPPVDPIQAQIDALTTAILGG